LRVQETVFPVLVVVAFTFSIFNPPSLWTSGSGVSSFVGATTVVGVYAETVPFFGVISGDDDFEGDDEDDGDKEDVGDDDGEVDGEVEGEVDGDVEGLVDGDVDG
jgi:hypothetical protein